MFSPGRFPSGVTGYAVSISGCQRIRRLHFMGACFRVPGLDYLDFEILGDSIPNSDLYDVYCGQCWAGGEGPPRALDAEEVEDGDTSSSEDSEAPEVQGESAVRPSAVGGPYQGN